MKITREADYALRIVALLAKSEKHTEAKEISEKSEIPYRFTLKILRKLVQAGYLKSFRGVNGGYMLNKAPSEITFRNIIEVIDGDITLNVCLGGEDCCSRGECVLKKKLKKVQDMLTSELDGINFKDVMEM